MPNTYHPHVYFLAAMPFKWQFFLFRVHLLGYEVGAPFTPMFRYSSRIWGTHVTIIMEKIFCLIASCSLTKLDNV
ncbi:hypothetical protein F0562_022331 [Nyssa sinensis]|uniref:Uncharacterized protein n=1 Tax=Nyssa sinensis TaxID=561372 RepID=A0A5J5BN89_9ASTE|nr:hypothetical protein F0562_022331 [Nyssa sinensis]